MGAALLLLVQSAFIPPQADLEFVRSVAGSQLPSVERKKRAVRGHVALTVDPKGRVYDCELLAFDGDEESAAEICDVTKDHRATPARWSDGDRVHGVFEMTFRFSTPEIDRNNPVETRRLDRIWEIAVAEMPAGVDDPYLLDVDIAVDAQGDIVSCAASRDDLDERFVGPACGLVREQNNEILHNKSGEPVRYVKKISLLFGTGDAKPHGLSEAPLPDVQ